jgi:thiol-disulfide isomerase/thioredoxin
MALPLRLFLTCAVLLVSAAAATKGPDPLVVAHGEKVELTDYLVPGKTVVFDFTSKYCGPCQAYEEPLKELHQKRADIAVVKVDINRPGVKKIDWQSPVAQQYRMDSIPRFKIFGPDGKLLAEDVGSNKPARKLVNTWCEALGL